MAGLTIEQQLVKIKEKEAALNARLEQKKALELKQAGLKAIREEKKKASDKARRVKLAGEFVLSKLDDGKVKSWLIGELDKHLTEPEDRRLFPELPKPIEAKAGE